jgi:hypothetical protein
LQDSPEKNGQNLRKIEAKCLISIPQGCDGGGQSLSQFTTRTDEKVLGVFPTDNALNHSFVY